MPRALQSTPLPPSLFALSFLFFLCSSTGSTYYQNKKLGLTQWELPEGSPAAAGLPAGWEAYVGEQDKLLNPTGVGEAIVGCQTVEGLGHDLRTFLTP
jgi:hypothetical protein